MPSAAVGALHLLLLMARAHVALEASAIWAQFFIFVDGHAGAPTEFEAALYRVRTFRPSAKRTAAPFLHFIGALGGRVSRIPRARTGP